MSKLMIALFMTAGLSLAGQARRAAGSVRLRPRSCGEFKG